MKYVATLSFGLRDDSRIKRKLSNAPVGVDTLLLAHIVDRLSMLVWFKTEDAQRGQNRPQSMVQMLMDANKPKDYEQFDTVEEFEKIRHQLMSGE